MGKKSDKTWIWVVIIVVILIAVAVYFFYLKPQAGAAHSSQQRDAATETAAPQAETAAPQAAAAAASLAATETTTTWLELPAPSSSTYTGCTTMTHRAHLQGPDEERNYTIFYDPETMIAYWVAYPICAAHLGSGREEAWGYDPKIDQKHQTKVSKGYGANIATANYPKNFYARGHQIANADRSGAPEMMAQTYYSTNMTPQLQNGFNGGIWAKLEDAVRGMVPHDDTLYVVTGAVFSKKGHKDTIKTILNHNDSKTLQVPNYYYKVVLKVDRNPQGTITGARTLGFWLPHDDLKGHTWDEYTMSVDQIEEFTGFDFFPGLPDSLENAAEANSSLTEFAR